MGNEQLEAGNTAGERTCWRKSSSAVNRVESDDRRSDVLAKTRERTVESAREAAG